MGEKLPHSPRVLEKLLAKQRARHAGIVSRMRRLAKQAEASRRLMDRINERLDEWDDGDKVWLGPDGTDPETPNGGGGMCLN